MQDGRAVAALSFQLGYEISEAETTHNIELAEESGQDIVYVATLNNNVVGWIHIFYSLKIESRSFCEIGGLIVDENVRGKGIGGMLIMKAVEWSKNRSSETLRVRTNVIRLETHKFYEKMGFVLKKQQSVFGMSLDK